MSASIWAARPTDMLMFNMFITHFERSRHRAVSLRRLQSRFRTAKMDFFTAKISKPSHKPPDSALAVNEDDLKMLAERLEILLWSMLALLLLLAAFVVVNCSLHS